VPADTSGPGRKVLEIRPGDLSDSVPHEAFRVVRAFLGGLDEAIRHLGSASTNWLSALWRSRSSVWAGHSFGIVGPLGNADLLSPSAFRSHPKAASASDAEESEAGGMHVAFLTLTTTVGDTSESAQVTVELVSLPQPRSESVPRLCSWKRSGPPEFQATDVAMVRRGHPTKSCHDRPNAIWEEPTSQGGWRSRDRGSPASCRSVSADHGGRGPSDPGLCPSPLDRGQGFPRTPVGIPEGSPHWPEPLPHRRTPRGRSHRTVAGGSGVRPPSGPLPNRRGQLQGVQRLVRSSNRRSSAPADRPRPSVEREGRGWDRLPCPRGGRRVRDDLDPFQRGRARPDPGSPGTECPHRDGARGTAPGRELRVRGHHRVRSGPARGFFRASRCRSGSGSAPTEVNHRTIPRPGAGGTEERGWGSVRATSSQGRGPTSSHPASSGLAPHGSAPLLNHQEGAPGSRDERPCPQLKRSTAVGTQQWGWKPGNVLGPSLHPLSVTPSPSVGR